VRRFWAFWVRLPAGGRYWTVVDTMYQPVATADDWLLHVRLGRNIANWAVTEWRTASVRVN